MNMIETLALCERLKAGDIISFKMDFSPDAQRVVRIVRDNGALGLHVIVNGANYLVKHVIEPELATAEEADCERERCKYDIAKSTGYNFLPLPRNDD